MLHKRIATGRCHCLRGHCLRGLYLLGLCLLATNLGSAQEPDPAQLPEFEELAEQLGEHPELMMQNYLQAMAQEQLAAHREAMLAMEDPAEIRAWQQEMRAWFENAIGGLPPSDTPLNAQVTGTLEREGFRVEKILFESRPGFFVTAALFLPDAEAYAAPYPAVLVACGHSHESKAYEVYQRGCALLAVNGVAAMIFDPIDQGERLQTRGHEGHAPHWGTLAHDELGIGSMLLGTNTSQFMIHDAMRCFDYLESRDDIDGENLGMAGNSGGGTQTSLVMALDERVKAAAPSCYITGLEAWLALDAERADVPADAEQNVAGQVAAGLDHWGFLALRAPLPTLVCSARQDFFPIAGTESSVGVAGKVYERLEAAEMLEWAVDEGEHGWNQSLREATATFMVKHLRGEEREIHEPEGLRVLSAEEIQVTPTGQVLDIEGARSAYDLNGDRLAALREQRAELWAGDVEAALAEVRRVTGVRPLAEIPQRATFDGPRLYWKDYYIESFGMRVQHGLMLPGSVIYPEDEPTGFVIWLDAVGFDNEESLAGIEEQLAAGNIVLALDLRGLGVTQDAENTWYGLESANYMFGYLLDRSYTAMRAEDILYVAQLLDSAPEEKRMPIDLVARGDAVAVPALLAAALEPDLFDEVTIEGDLESYEEIVTDPAAGTQQLVHVVHGALEVYDLPDLRRVVLGEE